MSGRSSTFVAASRVAGLLMVCGAGACAQSHTRTTSEPDVEIQEPSDGAGRGAPFEPDEPVPDEPKSGIAGPKGMPPDAGAERDDPIQNDPPDPILDVPPPIEMKPPPEIVHERATGAAVLDIDPDEPRTWVDRIVCEKIRECGVGGMELLTQEECEALMGGSCARYPQVPEEVVEPECIQAVDDTRCADLPIALMTPACVESVTRVISTLAGTTELRAEGEVCGSTALCESGLTCRDQVGACGFCRPYGQIGDDCSDQLCLGSYCNADSLRCTPYLRAGEPCDWRGGCLAGCGPDGLCQGFLTSSRSPPFYVGCVEDDICGGGECRDGYCLPPAPLGAACERDAQCLLGRCHEGVCATSASCELPGEGEYCARLGECQPPFACERGRCTSVLGISDPLPEGAYCVHPAQCATGSCEYGLCSRRSSGSSCKSDEECSSGRCVYGLCAPEFMQLCPDE